MPSLRGAALRAPYFHDGRARTLEAAASQCAGSAIEPGGAADLVAYLATL